MRFVAEKGNPRESKDEQRKDLYLFFLIYYMKSDLQLKQETIQYQHAGVYTTVLQSGHQFCIGNDC